MPDAPPWDDIRYAYENSPDTLAVIAERYGVTLNQIRNAVRGEDWVRRPSGPEMLLINRARQQAASLIAGSPGLAAHAEPAVEPATDATAGASAAPVGGPALTRKARTAANGTASHRKRILERLYNLLDAKLAEVERRVAERSALSATDAERESRQIAGLLKTYETLVELADAALQASARSDTVDSTSDNDAARLRADILARYERLRGQGGLPAPAADTHSA